MTRSGVLLCTLFLSVGVVVTAAPAAPYRLGDDVKVECQNWGSGEWGPALVCKETGEELRITFGMEGFVACSMEIAGDAMYQSLVQIIRLNRTWQCRVPVSANDELYVPFTIPLWGVVEDDHIHVCNRVSFIFHVEAGKILAASIYPVRDRFQFGKPGSLISMHGPVKWFQGGTYQSFAAPGDTAALEAANSTECSLSTILGLMFLSSFATLLFAAWAYQRRLKPSLLRKLNKNQ